MNKTGPFKHRRIRAFIGTMALLLAVLLPRFASAGNNSGPLTHTEYLFNIATINGVPTPNSQLLLQLNGNSSVNYYANQLSPGCGIPNVDIDTIKIWVSIAQAAELSGKSAQIYYNTCGTLNYITDVLIFN